MSKTDKGLSRRNVLAALAIAGVGGAGGLALFTGTGGEPDAIRAILHRLIGPFTMAEADFNRFVTDFAAGNRALKPMEADTLRLLEAVPGAQALAEIAPGFAHQVATFDRKLLTEFALATGLDGPGNAGQLEYRGLFRDNPCSNPFAQLT